MGTPEKGRELFAVLGFEQGMVQIIADQAIQIGVSLEEEIIGELSEGIKEVAGRAYAENFSDEEMDNIIAFHQSPTMILAEKVLKERIGPGVDELLSRLAERQESKLTEKMLAFIDARDPDSGEGESSPASEEPPDDDPNATS